MSDAAERRPALRRLADGILLAGALAVSLRAQSALFYLELQAVGGWSTASGRVQRFSLKPDDVMQALAWRTIELRDGKIAAA